MRYNGEQVFGFLWFLIWRRKMNPLGIKDVYDFLKKCGTYYLATCDNGKPRVRPFGTVDLFNGNLYIQTGKIKAVSKQMHENPWIEICAFDGSMWLRLACEVLEDDNIRAREHMLDQYPELKAMYKADDGNTEVFCLKNASGAFYSFSGEPKPVEF